MERARERLHDSWEREIRSVRVSVTDKCNFRCRYCMPAEGLEWLERDELLSFEEIERLLRGLARMGGDEGGLAGGGAPRPRGPPSPVPGVAPTPRAPPPPPAADGGPP